MWIILAAGRVLPSSGGGQLGGKPKLSITCEGNSYWCRGINGGIVGSAVRKKDKPCRQQNDRIYQELVT